MSTNAPVATEPEITPQWIRPGRWMLLTGMSHGATYQAIRDGKIRATRIGERWYIPASELSDFFERHGRPAAA